MSYNASWDSSRLSDLNVPYNRTLAELDDTPRVVRGENVYITLGGKMCRRPGTEEMANGDQLGYRVDRIWTYETLDTPPKVYLVFSLFNLADNVWELWYQQQDTAPVPWIQVSNYRDINLSTAPHVAVASRGLLFIKGFPSDASSEKLGTIIFDGTAGAVTLKPWGLLGPTDPATIVGAVTHITTSGGINDSDTSFTVADDTDFPSTPFVIQVDYEQMEVTGDVTNTFTVTRGFNGTVAAAHQENTLVIYRGWSASDHIITVNQYWEYAFAWVTITGHYSNRSPSQSNPDLLPSRTGPFFNQVPEITVQGHADTTNIPSIAIFRTTDGGGSFYLLDTIDNSGAGAIVYEDNTLASGPASNVFDDPIPDASLDTASFAPSLTSNSPPPSVLAPQVVGVDTPIQSTPIAGFQGRLWYAVGNVLFFSAQEELNLGVPEEAWPSGLLGNFFRFQYPITNVFATVNNLYVFTLKAIYVVSGTNLETFSPQLLLDNYGHPYGHPRAIAEYSNTLVFLNYDYRIVSLSDGGNPVVLSDPLFTDIVDQINISGEFDLKYFADLDKEWIVVAGHVPQNPILSRQWVYDIKKSQMTKQPFWFLPWTYPSTCIQNCRISESTAQRRLVFSAFDPTTTQEQLARLDPTGVTSTDFTYDGEVTFNLDIVYSLGAVPAGDHVNERRVPGITPVVYSIIFERLSFPGDDDPYFYYFKDDIWTTPLSINNAEDPPRRNPSRGYKTMEFMIFEVAQRVAWELTKVGSADRFELESFYIKFDPNAGV